MGLTVGKVVVDGNIVRNGVETYLTDSSYNNLYIVETTDSIDVVSRNYITSFISCDIDGMFDETSYSLILIVLEKMVLDDIKFNISFNKTELMNTYLERKGEIRDAKLAVNIL